MKKPMWISFVVLSLLAASFGLPNIVQAGETLFVTCRAASENDRAACRSLEEAFLHDARVETIRAADVALSASVSATSNDQAVSPCVTKPEGSRCAAWLNEEGVSFRVAVRGEAARTVLTLKALKTDETLWQTEEDSSLSDMDQAAREGLARKTVDELVRSLAPRPQDQAAPESTDQGQPVLARRVIRYSWLPLGLTLASGIAAALVSAEAAHLEDKFQTLVDKAKTEAQPASSVKDAKTKADDQAFAANVMWGVTGVLAAVTVTSFCLEYFLAPEDPQQGRRIVLAPGVAPDQASVQLFARF